MMNSTSVLDLNVGVVDPRKSAEAISMTYLHCILKGLHKSPKIINDPELVFHPDLFLSPWGLGNDRCCIHHSHRGFRPQR